MLDLWTWGGWIEAYVFFFFYYLLKNLLAGTVIAIGFAIVYALSDDLPLCIAGDIMLEIPFVDPWDVCVGLGLDTDTISMRKWGGEYVKDEIYKGEGYAPKAQK